MSHPRSDQNLPPSAIYTSDTLSATMSIVLAGGATHIEAVFGYTGRWGRVLVFHSARTLSMEAPRLSYLCSVSYPNKLLSSEDER